MLVRVARLDDAGKACHWSVPFTPAAAATAAADCFVLQRRRSRCSPCPSISLPPRCPSPSATCCTCASRKATRRYLRANGSGTRSGQATTSIAPYEWSSRRLECRTMRATSTSTWPQDDASGANCADSSPRWYPVVAICQTATGLHKPLSPRDCRKMQSLISILYTVTDLCGTTLSKTTINADHLFVTVSAVLNTCRLLALFYCRLRNLMLLNAVS